MENKKDLVQKLKKDERGKPILQITPFSRTGISTPTEKDYLTLMRILECGGLKWRNGRLPTYQETDYWRDFRENTCIDAGVNYNLKEKFNGIFGYSSKNFYERENLKVISMQEFYNFQEPPITSGIIKEINDWFENRKQEISL